MTLKQDDDFVYITFITLLKVRGLVNGGGVIHEGYILDKAIDVLFYSVSNCKHSYQNQNLSPSDIPLHSSYELRGRMRRCFLFLIGEDKGEYSNLRASILGGGRFEAITDGN